MTWTSSNVSAGDDVLATDHNTLRADMLNVFEKAPPIGSIVMWAGGSADVPAEWKLCDGSAISRTTYSDLYTLLGNTFGAGNGSTTFNIPDMRDRFVVGAGTSYSRNSKGGSASVSHSHTVNSHTHSDGSFHAEVYGASTTLAIHRATGANYTTDVKASLAFSADSTGGRTLGAHVSGTSGSASPGTSSANLDNRPPYVGIYFIIKVL